jgi:hypothetical protein
VRPLARLHARETAQDSALRIDLQDTPSYGVAHVEEVVRREDKAKGMPKSPLPQELAISVEDLDACVLPVAHLDQVTINCDRMGSCRTARPGTLYPPPKQRPAVLVELQNPRIGDAAYEFAGGVELHERMLATMENVNVPFGIDGDTSQLDHVLFWGQLKEIRDHVVIQFR